MKVSGECCSSFGAFGDLAVKPAASAVQTAAPARRPASASELRFALHQLLDGQTDFVLATKDGTELLLARCSRLPV
jgi:hypothetical protein